MKKLLIAVIVAFLTSVSLVGAQVQSDRTIKLTWVDASNNEAGFVVYLNLGTTGSVTNYQEIARTGPNVTTLEVKLMAAEGEQKCFAVAAFTSAGESTKSEDCVTVRATIPNAPEQLIAEIIAKLEELRKLVK